MSLQLESHLDSLSWWPGVLTSIAVVLGVISISYYARRTFKALPPGPKGLPLLGNVLQLPTQEPWRVYKEWEEKYGDVIYLEALGQPIVVLNSLKATQELLFKRAANYSDRMFGPVDQLMATGWGFAVLKYGNAWRERRRAFHAFFTPSQIPSYHPIIEEGIHNWLHRLSSKPEDFFADTRFFWGSLIMRMAYGTEDEPYIKALIRNVETYLRAYFEFASPGRLFVSSFPIMRHIPAWLPGAGWKRTLFSFRDLGLSSIQKPWDDVKGRAQSGEGGERRYPDLASTLLEELPDETHPTYAGRDVIARDVAGMTYVGGSDTTVSASLALIAALCMNPELQRKAQAEIDQVTDGERLPTCDDMEKLPYCQALVKEVNRWHTVLPLAVPHISVSDDVYEGYHIPAGTWCLPNSWAIMHDPTLFDKPMEFNPERYLKNGKINTDVLDPEAASFGYGRRLCPGRQFTSVTMTCMIASLLAVYDIKHAEDEAGNQIPVNFQTESIMVIVPRQFQCKITPRSPKHEALLHL
ncbi:cytochrome P450 98A3 [Coprinopsis sp. MPI-PUGE-AT-0042]|nr:cytochrome P450 98A3 [Coprinopsis sp. MPI-PUGE-AT-0042]